MKRYIRPLLAVMLVMLAGACVTTERVDESHAGVRYNDGWVEGQSFSNVVEPGGTERVYNDHVYKLPIRQITWQTGTCDGCDAPSLLITTKDRLQLSVDLAIRGTLNTDDATLEEFFNNICNKTRSRGDEEVTGCWENADEKGQLGWDLMLTETFGNPMIAVANDIGATFEGDSLRYTPEVKDLFAEEFAKQFSTQQGRLVGNSDYFCQPGFKRNSSDGCENLTVEVTGVKYTNETLENAPSQVQASIEAEKLAKQQELQALAEAAVQRAKATVENLALLEAEALMACASNPECTLIWDTTGNANVNVNTG